MALDVFCYEKPLDSFDPSLLSGGAATGAADARDRTFYHIILDSSGVAESAASSPSDANLFSLAYVAPKVRKPQPKFSLKPRHRFLTF